MNPYVFVAAAAIVLDYIIGDPQYLLHPVRLIGRLIGACEKVLYRSGKQGWVTGILLVGCVTGTTTGCVCILYHVSGLLYPPLQSFLSIYIVYSCIAYRDLISHCHDVQAALAKNDIDLSRRKLALIVGRDVSSLDAYGIGRAVVETLAENFVDGFLAPVFWYTAGCFIGRYLTAESVLPGVLCVVLYRTVNTLDSMVGYKSDRYRHFGWGGARLDDIANFIPARLSVVFLAAGAFLCRMNLSECMSVTFRDRLKHASPNAGHPESCVAGALHIRLGGPVTYAYGVVQKPWMGNGPSSVGTEHIRKALSLVNCSFFICSIIVVMILVFM